MYKHQYELTRAECLAAMRHDNNFWWAHGTCHKKFLRYAAGVVIRDTRPRESPETVVHKGVLFNITQYRPKEALYCGHMSYCLPSKDIKLLGSVIGGPYDDEKRGDETDLWQSVDTSCELIIADKANIIKARAYELFKDCH